MDVLGLARLAFALVAGLHFIFVVVTLGTVLAVVTVNTAWTLTRKPVYERMTRLVGQVYVINYALGILSGLVMEFQLGMNWNGLSLVTGSVFGIPIALETLLAFFAESTFLGLWIFGWRVLNRWVHLALIWLVALTAFLSAYSIMVANGFMHNPVGFQMNGSVAELTDFGALLTNPSAVWAFFHIVGASLWAGGFAVAAMAAYYFTRRTSDVELASKMIKIGVWMGAIGSPFVLVAGFAQFGAARPAGFDSTESTATGLLLAFMLLFGMLNTLVVWCVMLPLLIRTVIAKVKPLLYLMMWLAPLPILVTLMGWTYREEARQPWAVVGVLGVDKAVSPLGFGSLLAFTVGFVAVLVALLVLDYKLILRTVRQGPDATALGAFAEPMSQPGPAVQRGY